ncbi:hypothetical protein Tcan_10445 [Toxocara canis]|uniref:DUF7778 domain-containing protein n=1 Tax=Toxocara canis TaxID=6265 RepID=A0A0B2V197_TOXCA|nr:hypothetical protein Tcan_10445 [Toxocara canis]
MKKQDDHQAFFSKSYIAPSHNLRKEQILPLRSDWRFPESGAVVFGNVEIRRSVALFWTKVSTRFCAITDQGLLLIYGEKEKGIAIDLKTVRSVHSNIAEKKLNGTLVPRCLITLRHKCGDSIVLCIRGKNEIAKWRCAIWSVIQLSSQRTSVRGSRRIRRSASYGEPEGAKFQFSTPTDPDEVDYWNSPEAGKQMTSPKIYRALSHHALMHRVRSSSLRPAFSASLTFTASNTKRTPTEFGKGQTNVDVVGLREVCTLPRRASLRKPFVPAIILGSFRKERDSVASPLAHQEATYVTAKSDEGNGTSAEISEAPSPAFSIDSGVVSRADSPSKNGAHEQEATYVTAKSDEGNGTSAEISEAPSPAFSIDSGVVSRADSPSKNGAHEQTEERDCIVRDDSVRSNCSRNVEETVKESANISRSVPKAYLPTQAKNASITLPILIADDLNIEGIFEEVLRYLKDDCSHWR